MAADGGDAAAFRAQRSHPPLQQRGPQALIDYSRSTLQSSLAAYRAGDREQAYDLAVGAYLEGFELVESALDNLDAVQRKTTERALLAYRQTLQDGAMDNTLSFFASRRRCAACISAGAWRCWPASPPGRWRPT